MRPCGFVLLALLLAGDFLMPAGAHAQQFVYLAEWGGSGSGPGQFSAPLGIAVGPNGHVYVADKDNHRIQEFTSDGAFVSQWGTYGAGPGQFMYAACLAIDGAGNVYVTDGDNLKVLPGIMWLHSGPERGIARVEIEAAAVEVDRHPEALAAAEPA